MREEQAEEFGHMEQKQKKNEKIHPDNVVWELIGTRKVKPFSILMKQEMMGGNGISKSSAPRSRQVTMPAPHYSVFTGRCSFCRATNSVKASGKWPLQQHECGGYSHPVAVDHLCSRTELGTSYKQLGSSHWWQPQDRSSGSMLFRWHPFLLMMSSLPNTCNNYYY